MADDLRTAHWLEAEQNIRQANTLPLEDPAWWATILVAIANGILANSDPELVAQIRANRQNTQQKVQKAVKRGLKGGANK